MCKHKISLESCPSPGKEILAQDANGALLVDRAIHHHQLRFATKRLWTVWAETQRPVHLISSTLILDDVKKLFLIMIQITARSSLGVVNFNRCPYGLWIALPASRTRQRTLEMPPCYTPVFLDIGLWDSQRPDNWTMSSRITGGVLACMIATLFWNYSLCIATAHSWMYSTQMWHTGFWSN